MYVCMCCSACSLEHSVGRWDVDVCMYVYVCVCVCMYDILLAGGMWMYVCMYVCMHVL
jgi:hypothetical protein